MDKWPIFICSLLLFLGTGSFASADKNKVSDFLQNIQSTVENLTFNENLSQTSKKYVTELRLLSNSSDESESNEIVCKSCHKVIDAVITYRRSGATKKFMITLFQRLCNTFTDWGTLACKGYIDIELDTVLFIIDNKRDLAAERVCAIHFQENKCSDPAAKNWTIPIPPEEDSNEVVERNLKLVSDKPLKILQLTDIHFDPEYKPGSNAVCDKPLCCQTGTPSDPKNAAGFWGDYNVCDMPRHSVDNLLQQIKDEHLEEIDFVYYTGDIISHKSWDTSKGGNTRTIKEIYGLFEKTFGNKTVYPILGNHEPHPTDFYSPYEVQESQLSTQWVYKLSVEEWSRWLPNATRDSILKGGYYSILVKQGFRVIALNSNLCFVSNLWLIYNDEDPHQQLNWLVQELSKAEMNKENVHILSHIPPGEILCHKRWSNQFRKIIERFSKIIKAQFNGHTHFDEFRVFKNPSNSSEVINVAFNGASFTTFVGFNPNYRIYEVDSSNFNVINYDQFVYNLTKANGNNSHPEWYKLYSFKEAYGLDDLSYESFGKLLEKMPNDWDLLGQYFRFMVRDSDVKIKDGCDRKCLKQLFCYITAVEANESVNC